MTWQGFAAGFFSALWLVWLAWIVGDWWRARVLAARARKNASRDDSVRPRRDGGFVPGSGICAGAAISGGSPVWMAPDGKVYPMKLNPPMGGIPGKLVDPIRPGDPITSDHLNAAHDEIESKFFWGPGTQKNKIESTSDAEKSELQDDD